VLNASNGCVQRTQQLSECSVIIVYDWSKPSNPGVGLINLDECTNSSKRSLDCWVCWTHPMYANKWYISTFI